MSWGHFTPRYAPLRALAWGYDCIVLRAMSLRDGIPLPDNDSLHRTMQFFVKITMNSTVMADGNIVVASLSFRHCFFMTFSITVCIWFS